MTTEHTFGDWLQERRRALDLTQEALAHQVGCSVATLYKLEAGTRRPSKHLAERLATCLALAPDEHSLFIRLARGLPDALPPSSPNAPSLTTLPRYTSSFVGRKPEIAKIARLLQQPNKRILTLTGAPGIGKTRLAVHIAEAVVQYFPDGVLFIPLVALRDPGLILPTIAHTLTLQEQPNQSILTVLKEALRGKQLLLILDNMEHLIEGAAEVAALRMALPELTIIVTSRSTLRIADEYVFTLTPLPLPDPRQQPSPQPITNVPSVKLFIERARTILPNIQLTPANIQTIAEICSALEGLPLSIELATARLRILSLQDLHQRLQRRLTLLSSGERDRPPHQQSLLATLTWSYELLPPDAQRLVARLAVFVGGWTLEAAESICSDDPRPPAESQADPIIHLESVLDILALLIESNLVQHHRINDNHIRYSMLETIREYAFKQLTQRGELEDILQKHTHYYTDWLTQSEDEINGAEQSEWIPRLDHDHDNLRAVLQRAIRDQNKPILLKITACLWTFWFNAGYLTEGRAYLDYAVTNTPSNIPHELAPYQATALNGAGIFTREQGDYQQAQRYFEASLRLFQQIDQKRAIGAVFNNLGGLAYHQTQFDKASTYYQQGLQIFQSIGDTWRSALILNNLGEVATDQGNIVQAAHFHETSLQLYQEAHDEVGITYVLDSLGRLANLQNHYTAALSYAEQCLTFCQKLNIHTIPVYETLGYAYLGHKNYKQAIQSFQTGLTQQRKIDAKLGIILMLEGIAAVTGIAGNPLHAAQIYGAITTLRTTLDTPLSPFITTWSNQWRAIAQTRLDTNTWNTAWSEGQQMSLEQAILYAQNTRVENAE